MPQGDITVEIPDVGTVAFPGSMSPDQIKIKAKELHDKHAKQRVPTPDIQKPSAVPAAASKATSIGPPEGLLAYGKRQVTAVGKTLKESLPFVGGAVGAVTAGAAAAPTGPVGVATAGVAGAGAGGAAGRIAEQYIDYLRGHGPRPTFLGAVSEGGKAATSQMEQQMAGEVIAAPLGFFRRGGFLKTSGETMKTLASDRALGTNLSGPEISSGTRLGEIGKTLQKYSTGAFAGGQIQREAREKGSRAAFTAIDDALAVLGHPGMTSGPTAASKGSSYAAREFLGQQLDAAADAAPPIDVTSVKDAAAKELEKGIVQHIKAVPDVADPRTAALIRSLRADPALIQKMPRPALSRLADLVLEKFKSPSIQLLKRIVGMEDSTAARGVWDELKALQAKGKAPDELYASSDSSRIASFLKGKLRTALGEAAPAFGKALGQYRDIVRGDYLRDDIVLGGKPFPTNEGAANTALTGMADRLRSAAKSGRLVREFGDASGQQVVQNLTKIANVLEKRQAASTGPIRQIMEIGRMLNIPVGLVTGHLTQAMGAQAILWEGLPDFLTWTAYHPQATKWFIEGTTAKNPVQSSAAIVRLMDLYRQTQQPQKANGTPTPPR